MAAIPKHPPIHGKAPTAAADGVVTQTAGTTTSGSIFGKAVDGTYTVTNRAMNVGLLAPIAVPIVGGAIRITGRAAGAVGLKGLAQGSSNINAKIDTFSNKTLSEVAGKNIFSRSVARASQAMANVTGSVVGGVARFTGIEAWRKAANTANAEKFTALAKQHAVEFEGHIGAMPAAIKGHAITLLNHHNDLLNHHNGIAVLGDERLAAVEKNLAETKIAFTNAAKTVNPGKPVLKSLATFEKTSGKAIGYAGSAKDWGNIGKSIKGMPTTIGGSKVFPGMMNGAFVGVSALGMFGEARGFKANLASLSAMNEDITGKKASTFSLLFGTVPAPVAEARSKLMKTFTISETAGVASLALAIKMAMNRRVSMAAFFVPQLASMGAGALVGDSVVPVYNNFKQAFASGQEIPADAYAEFLVAASKELRGRGDANNEFTKKLAEQYAAEKASPAKIMQEISDGKLMYRVHSIIEAAKPAVAATTVVAVNEAPEHSHVKALEERAAGKAAALPKSEQVAVGKHTETQIARANEAQTPRQL